MRSIGSRSTFAAMGAAAIAVAVGALGCGSGGAQTNAATAANAQQPSPVVPSGVSFHATLDGPLSSQHASVGDKITATLDDPLRSMDGLTLVPKGAKLHGHILEVGREGINRLVLQFDTIEFGGRHRPIYAQVSRIDSARVVASESAEATSMSVDVYPMLPRGAAAPEVGGGPPPEQLPLAAATPESASSSTCRGRSSSSSRAPRLRSGDTADAGEPTRPEVIETYAAEVAPPSRGALRCGDFRERHTDRFRGHGDHGHRFTYLNETVRAALGDREARRVGCCRHPHGGFGVGLWLCRCIAVALGGSLEIEGEPGQGATFRCTLPKAGPPEPHAIADRSRGSTTSSV